MSAPTSRQTRLVSSAMPGLVAIRQKAHACVCIAVTRAEKGSSNVGKDSGHRDRIPMIVHWFTPRKPVVGGPVGGGKTGNSSQQTASVDLPMARQAIVVVLAQIQLGGVQ